MKIVVIYQYYQGHGSPGHSLVYDLTHFLARQGHEVTVVTGETGYMQATKSTLPWYRRLIKREIDGQVNIVRTYSSSQLHRNYWTRFLSFISFSLTAPLGLLNIKKPDVVLASSPPIFPVFSSWLVCKIRRIKFVIEVRDLWPSSMVEMGLLKNKILIKVISWMERLLYDQSARIVALTEGIRDNISARGWPEHKIELVTCGVDFDKLYPDAIGRAKIREKYGWENKSVIMYFGALGEANNLTVILRAAAKLRHRQDIIFVLIGDGMKRAEIKKQITNQGMDNVLLLPPVPKDEARLYINAADICMVTLLDIPLFNGAIPTKLLDYMGCGKPVLGGVRGEAARLICEAEGGVVFSPDDDDELKKLVIDILNSPELMVRMGESGLAYVKNRFSAKEIRAQMESILSEVVNRGF